MQKRITYILLIIILQCTAGLHAQQLQVTATVDSNTYLIGDYIRYNLQVKSPSNYTFNWPVTDTIGGKLETISVSAVDTLLQNDTYLLHQQIVFSAYDSGIYTIQPVYVEYKMQGDTSHYFAGTESIRLLIQTVPVDTTQAIKPIKENITVHVPDYTVYYLLGGIVLISLLTYFIYKYIQKRRREKPVTEKITPITLYNHTMERLRSLEAKKLWQQDAYKAYHSELTEIIREYLDARFDLQTMESTSDEIVELAVNAGIQPPLLNNLEFILRTADLAKFAKSKPLPQENTQSMQFAVQIVEETKLSESKTKEPLQ